MVKVTRIGTDWNAERRLGAPRAVRLAAAHRRPLQQVATGALELHKVAQQVPPVGGGARLGHRALRGRTGSGADDQLTFGKVR